MMWGNSAKDYDILSNSGKGETFAEVARRRYTRRSLLKGLAAAGAAAVAGQIPLAKMVVRAHQETAAASQTAVFPLGFQPISGVPKTVEFPTVANGHTIQTLIRWGDPITAVSPEFDPENLTAASQEQQFGYNCDFVGYFPLTPGVDENSRGILAVNHEYTNQNVMFRNYNSSTATKAQVDVEMTAHGVSIIEIWLINGEWQYVRNSSLNRRYTVLNSPMIIAGPAAGNALLQTGVDATGSNVIGTINNCAGGKTPWGTVLTAEENFQNYFGNVDLMADGEIKAIHQRYGLQSGVPRFYSWLNHYDRFDTTKEPNESFRFGWVVEIDPYDPTWAPRKRTALGRFRHEAATIVISKNNKVVAYSGDDARFEYMYKFVSGGNFTTDDRVTNRDSDLLNDGTLYVAKLDDNGSGTWLPLVYGQNGLQGTVNIGGQDYTFNSQADVVAKVRLAADFLGATKMDRPEDIEANPINGKVYVALTNNTRRKDNETDEANPRGPNVFGHVLEITEDGDDHAGTSFTWDILLLGGSVDAFVEDERFAGYPLEQLNAAFSGISAPDNLTFDDQGNLWIATDGQPGTLDLNDGLFAVPVEGPQRGHIGQFFSGVKDAEICGPEFTPDNTTLFVAIQHPGDDGDFDNPSSRWPDFDPNVPPRPSILAIRTVSPNGQIGTEKVGQLSQPYRLSMPIVANGSSLSTDSD